MTELELEAILAIQNRAMFLSYDQTRKIFTGFVFSRALEPHRDPCESLWLARGNTREQVVERLVEKVFGKDSTNDF